MLCSRLGCEKAAKTRGECATHYKATWGARNPPSPERQEEILARRRARQRERYADDSAYREKAKTRQRGLYDDPVHREKCLIRERRRVSKCCSVSAEKLRLLQGGFCAICPCILTPHAKRGVIGEYADHDHGTDKLRGLLCRTCNTSLGGYERHQRPEGYVIAQFETYLSAPPADRL